MSEKKLKKISKEELDELKEASQHFCAGISSKRTRRKVNKDDLYFRAVEEQQADAGVRGGLIHGSKYHYERSFNG